MQRNHLRKWFALSGIIVGFGISNMVAYGAIEEDIECTGTKTYTCCTRRYCYPIQDPTNSYQHCMTCCANTFGTDTDNQAKCTKHCKENCSGAVPN